MAVGADVEEEQGVDDGLNVLTKFRKNQKSTITLLLISN
jgi:hypothetical protein